MKYALIVHEGPLGLDQLNRPQQCGSYLAAWHAYATSLAQSGVLRGGVGLQPPATATTLRFGPDGTALQPGPLATSPEQLGGYFIVEVADLDAALACARRAPLAVGGAIEIRPVVVPPA